MEWYEQDNSEIKHYAPLLLIRLEELKQNKAQQKMTFTAADNFVSINLSLREKLKEFNLDLPDFNENDTPTIYLKKVSAIIKSYPKWKIKTYITIGRFVFSRLAMYCDLEIENWKNLLENKSSLLKTLFDSRVSDGNNENIYDIDKNEDVARYAPLLVTSADSSQHSAIIDVMKGNDLVIKGPPGTGKSQTITNLIANALNANKTILFMAEKKAALDVVFSRLKHVGLEDFCFELNSDKTNISHIRAGLEKSLKRHFEARSNLVSIPTTKIEKLSAQKMELRNYYDFLQVGIGKLNKTLCELIWSTKNLEKYVRNLPKSIKNFTIKNVANIDQLDLEKDTDELEKLKDLYNVYCDSVDKTKSKWDSIKSCPVRTQDIYYLFGEVELILESINQYIEDKRNLENRWPLNVTDKIKEVNNSTNKIKKYAEFLKENNVNPKLLDCFTKDENYAKINIFVTLIEKYHNIYKKLEKIYKEPLLVRYKLKNLEYLAKYIESHSFTSYSLKEFLDIQNKISNDLKNWKNNEKLKEITQIIYNANLELTVGEICCVKDILQDFVEVANLIPVYAQNMDIFKPYNWNVLDKIENEINELNSLYTKLTHVFDMEVVLNIEDISDRLNKVITDFSSSNFFSIFNRNYRSSKKFYKSIKCTQKYNSFLVVRNCKVLLKYIKQDQEFQKNNLFINCLKVYFHDIKTNIKDIQKIRCFFEKVNSLSDIYGEKIVQKLLDFCSLKEHFDSYQNIIKLSKFCNLFDLGLPILNINQAYEEYYNGLILQDQITTQFCQDLLDLFYNQDVLINDFIISIPLINDLNKTLSDIENYNEIVQNILPELAKKSKSDVSKLKGLLEFLDIVKHDKNIKNSSSFLQCIVSGELENIINDVETYNNKILFLSKQIEDIDSIFVFRKEMSENKAYQEKNLVALSTYFKELLEDKDIIYNICAFFDCLEKAKEQRYYALISYLYENNFSFDNLENIYLYLVYYNLLKNIHTVKWDRYIPNEMDKIAKSIRCLDNDIYSLNGKILITKLEQIHIPEGCNSARVSEKTELQLIRHQLSGHCRNIPLRLLINRAGKAIQALKPCFLMSPITVAQYIPPQSIEFDLLIIDEASQMYFEEALGGIFRAKQIVVVGDDKQLPPTPFFQKSNLQEEEFEENEDIIEDLSILDTCVAQGFEYRELLWHYRSKDSSLIAFSNNKFYNDGLKIFPTPLINSEMNGVQYCYIKGIYKNHQNEKEVEAIIKDIQLFVRCYPEKSLGIATINNPQKDLLEIKCDLLYQQDLKFKEYYDKWANTLESFFVKNLENIQGDERDYIFVSTVYGPEKEGERVLQRFGPINGKYGHRRLNVLFTRAKYGLKLFTSLKADDIIISEKSSLGLKIFRDYLLYAETGRIENGMFTGREFDSEFEKMVYDILIANGYEVDKQVGVKGFFIDLAVKHPKNKTLYVVGIECDGAPYHSTKSARDRDCIRQSILESLGWKIYRIWSKDWYYNTEKEIQKLLSYLADITAQDPFTEDML